MSTTGWYIDTVGTFRDFRYSKNSEGFYDYENPGFGHRRDIFRMDGGRKWRDTPTPLIGMLETGFVADFSRILAKFMIISDFYGAKQAIPPKTEVKVELKRAPAKFYLMSDNPNLDARIKISKARLHVGVREVNPGS